MLRAMQMVGGGVRLTHPEIDIAEIADDSDSFNLTSENTFGNGLFIDHSGMRMYYTGYRSIYQYALSAEWDISSSIYQSKAYNIDSAISESYPGGMFFKPDGLSMFLAAWGNEKVYDFSLSTAWDITTASPSANVGVVHGGGGPKDVFFKHNGLEFYVCNSSGVFQYTAQSSWAVSGASYASKSISLSDCKSITMDKYGKKLLVVVSSVTEFALKQYTLSTAWDISTASLDKTETISAANFEPAGIILNKYGDKIAILKTNGDDTVMRYSVVA